MKLLRLLIVLLPAGLTLAWAMDWLPVKQGYILVHIAGWQLETSLANLALAAVLLLLGWRLLRWSLKVPARALKYMQDRLKSRQLLRLLGAALEGDGTRLQREAEGATDPAVRSLAALGHLRDGLYTRAEAEASALEATGPLRAGARALRVRALHHQRGADAALELMDQLRFPPRHSGWLALRLKLLAELERWDEVRQILEATPSSPALQQHHARMQRKFSRYQLLHSDNPNAILERWREITDPQEAEQTLEPVIRRLLELHQPQLAAELLAAQFEGETMERAADLCFLLPPGSHCRMPLQVLEEQRKNQEFSRRQRATQAWLLLCCGETARAEEVLAQWNMG